MDGVLVECVHDGTRPRRDLRWVLTPGRCRLLSPFCAIPAKIAAHRALRGQTHDFVNNDQHTSAMIRIREGVASVGGSVITTREIPPRYQMPFGFALVTTTPRAVAPSSDGTFPVSTYLVSHDLANAKSPFSLPCTTTIPSMEDDDTAAAFLSASLHTRMASSKWEQDRRTSVTPMASDVSCSETANRDNLEMSLFALLERDT